MEKFYQYKLQKYQSRLEMLGGAKKVRSSRKSASLNTYLTDLIGENPNKFKVGGQIRQKIDELSITSGLDKTTIEKVFKEVISDHFPRNTQNPPRQPHALTTFVKSTKFDEKINREISKLLSSRTAKQSHEPAKTETPPLDPEEWLRQLENPDPK